MFEEQSFHLPVNQLHHHVNQKAKYSHEKCVPTNSSSKLTTNNLSYNKDPTISDHSETIMKISNYVDYSTAFHYSDVSNNTNNFHPGESIPSIVIKASIADLRRARYKETWDFLYKSDLIDVTLKTADLIKKNQLLQRDIDQLSEEVAKIIPSSKIHDVETGDFVLISSEQQA